MELEDQSALQEARPLLLVVLAAALVAVQAARQFKDLDLPFNSLVAVAEVAAEYYQEMAVVAEAAAFQLAAPAVVQVLLVQ